MSLALALSPGAGHAADSVVASGTSPAVQELQARLQATITAHGKDSAALIDPMLDLARHLAVEGYFARGYEFLERARTLSGRNVSPDDPGHNERVRRFALLRVQYANWLISGRNYRAAERLLRETENEISESFGSAHRLMIAPLVSRATLYGPRGYKLKERSRALKRAIEIAWQSEGLDPREIVVLYLREGDFYVVHRKPERAQQSYRQAWKLLRESSGSSAEADALLSSPELLWISSRIPVARMPIGGAGRRVTIRGEVSVGRDGRVKKARILNPDIDPGIARSAKRVLFWSTFRPAMRDGKVVAAHWHGIEREFELVLK